MEDRMWTEKRVRARWNEREERHGGSLFGTVLERGVTSLFLASERERETERQRGKEGYKVREGEGEN